MQKFDVAAALGMPELPKYLERVEQGIANALRTDNAFLRKPIRRILAVRGKRLRPSLVIAAATSQDDEVTEAVIAGCVAMELVHISSLVHDDIIDEANTRWGIPTISSKEGLAAAILVGDFLQAKACAVAATVSPEVARVTAETIAALCEGQGAELQEQNNIDRTEAAYFAAIEGKTASLIESCCHIGALCAGLPETQTKALAHYGHQFGIAFQLIDDVLDFTSTPEQSGKPTSNDVKEGNYTLPLLYAMASDPAGNVRKFLGDKTPANLAAITKLALQSKALTTTIELAEKYNSQAISALEILPDTRATESLRKFPNAYMQWALTKLAT